MHTSIIISHLSLETLTYRTLDYCLQSQNGTLYIFVHLIIILLYVSDDDDDDQVKALHDKLCALAYQQWG